MSHTGSSTVQTVKSLPSARIELAQVLVPVIHPLLALLTLLSLSYELAKALHAYAISMYSGIPPAGRLSSAR